MTLLLFVWLGGCSDPQSIREELQGCYKANTAPKISIKDDGIYAAVGNQRPPIKYNVEIKKVGPVIRVFETDLVGTSRVGPFHFLHVPNKEMFWTVHSKNGKKILKISTNNYQIVDYYRVSCEGS